MSKRISPELRTTALFKCIVTLSNGSHRILKSLSTHLVAHIVACYKTCKYSIFNEHLVVKVHDESVDVSDFRSIKFINERTGEELLSLA